MRTTLTALVALALSMIPVRAPLHCRSITRCLPRQTARPRRRCRPANSWFPVISSMSRSPSMTAGPPVPPIDRRTLMGSSEYDQRVPADRAERYGLYTVGAASFPFASLVGQIGASPYFLIGTNYSNVVSNTGQLSLMFWHSNSSDNFGSVIASVNVTAVP